MPIEDLNLAVLCGRLVTAPELSVRDSGSRELTLLVTASSSKPGTRIDVVPVTFYDPPDELVDNLPCANTRVWVTGVVQRRAHDGPDGRRSRIEIVADQVAVLQESRVIAAGNGR